MLARVVDDSGGFCLGDFVGKDSTNADAFLVDIEHNAFGFALGFAEELLKDEHDEVHGGIIVVKHQHLVKGGLPRCRFLRECDIAIGVVFGGGIFRHGHLYCLSVSRGCRI